MALGEEVLLYRPEDAEEMVRFARKHDCSAVKRTHTSIHTEMNLRGTIRNFLRFIKAMRENAEPSLSTELRNLYQEATEEIEHRQQLLHAFFARYSVGARIDQGPEWDHLQVLTESDVPHGAELSDEDEAFLRDRYLSLVLLQENNLVDMKEEGMIVRETIDPLDAITQYPSDLLLEPDSKDLAEYDITRLITTYSETSYPVTLGAEAVLTMELDELEEFGRSVEADDESLARLLMNLGLKKMIVDKIVLYLRGKKKVTKEDILGEMKDFDLTMPGDIDQFSFHLHPDFIEEVLDDLRKIKVIQGKDTKIRYKGE